LDHLPHVVAATYPLEAALFVEDRVDCFNIQMQMLFLKGENRRGDIAATSSHHQPLQRSQAH
jgi:hypothetical protein